ncbi:peptide chain release factor 3 [Luteococcus japonicus]|uniref:Peptide chain release factor 3 n=1 Tax=Luteococcus japonicus LSP_Lj1 TaxID=1255658 RepID=A0A1R4I8N3_9ACTN|nr:peptide chain release factor 3 [Luteococcus japonicus]SJN16160.1 Peptide chain release factor 3 [Luteococcus japonicus LSP_Lj1]
MSADTTELLNQAARRRTFAVISHPDAGKSTLTEALLLHAHVLNEAGATHGKAGRKATVSDWMEMEKDRGISISSSAIQFTHDGLVFNVVDTPGHADFSEDTYRVLTAVDSVIMLLDAAKGMEPQTMKLFGVCKQRGIPIITVINKWDRPGHDALALLDEVQERTGMRPTPLTWPVGISGDFHGVLDIRSGEYVQYTRTPGGSTLAIEKRMTPQQAEAAMGETWTTAVEEAELLTLDGYEHDLEDYLAQRSTVVLFAAAVLNFGIGQLLDVLSELAPPPHARPDADGAPRPLEAPFSAQVFKVQAGMDRNHRDRLAFARICSGIFHRGDVVTRAATGRQLATKYASGVFGRERETIEEAWPGDVIGLVNAGDVRAGDSLYLEEPVTFPEIPTFPPEHFRQASAMDPSKHKQFQRGIEQLDQEGVIQVLRSERRPSQMPILAAVGPMQFEVVSHRMEHEFHAPIRLEQLPLGLAMGIQKQDAPAVDAYPGAEAAERSDGTWLALFADSWQARWFGQRNPDVTLESLTHDHAGPAGT